MACGMYLTEGGTYFFVFILGVKYLFHNFIFNACDYFYNSSEDLEWSPSNVITCSTLKVAMGMVYLTVWLLKTSREKKIVLQKRGFKERVLN